MRKRRRTCTTIYLGSNDKRFEYVTDGNVKLADSVTIERWVVRLMACTKAWMRLDADGMRTIHGTRIEGLLNIELQWLAELTKARTIESEAFSVDDDDDDDDGDYKLKLRPLTARAIVAAEKDLDKRFADFEVAGEAVTCVWEDEDFGSLGKDIPQRLKQLGFKRTAPRALEFCRKLVFGNGDISTAEASAEDMVAGLPSTFGRNIRLIAEAFDLTRDELETLAFLAVVKHFAGLRSICNAYDYERRGLDLVVEVLSAAFGRKVSKTVFSKSKTLWNTGLISGINSRTPDFEDQISFLDDGDLLDTIFTIPQTLEEMFAHAVTAAPQSILTLKDFSHQPEIESYLLPYLKKALAEHRQGVNVLLYGPPGTGKTELARLLAKETGSALYEVSPKSGPDNGYRSDKNNRLTRWHCGERLFANTSQTMLLLDEADDVCNAGLISVFGMATTARTNKAELNKTLETAPVPTIWACNSTESMDPALMRRFDVVLEIPIPPESVRRRICRKAFDGAVSEHFIDRCAACEELSPGVAARTAGVVKTLSGEVDADETAEKLINATLMAQFGKELPAALNNVSDMYSTAFVNTDADLDAIAEGLKRTRSGRLCLYGAPGTGKSEYVRWLAARLDMPLVIKRASDLLSPYVGMTEKLIAAAFHSARQQGAVLLIDEADSFLQDRANARASWEVSQVNELLTQMESFPGIFCATTNLFKEIDRASLRRFDLKAEFRPMTTKQTVEFAKCCAGKLALGEISAADLARLERLDGLTPGDFAAVRRGGRFNPLKNTADFVTQLEGEVEMKEEGRKKPQIGFY